MTRRSAHIGQIPRMLRERGPLAAPAIIEELAIEPVKVMQGLWRMHRGGTLVIVDWRVALDKANRQKLLRVYGVAGVHQACDPAREAEVKKAHGVGLPSSQKPNYTYPPGTILPKPAPRARTQSGSGQIAGPTYHRGLKWFVNSSL